MSNPLRHPVFGPLVIGGAVAAIAGIIVWFIPNQRVLGSILVFGGFCAEFGGFWLHDLIHLRRGEVPTRCGEQMITIVHNGLAVRDAEHRSAFRYRDRFCPILRAA